MKLSITNQRGPFFFAFTRVWVLKGKNTIIYPINAYILEHPLVCQVVSKGKNLIDSWICNGGQTQGTILNSHKKKKEVKVSRLDKEELTNLCKVKSIYTNWKRWQLVLIGAKLTELQEKHIHNASSWLGFKKNHHFFSL